MKFSLTIILISIVSVFVGCSKSGFPKPELKAVQEESLPKSKYSSVKLEIGLPTGRMGWVSIDFSHWPKMTSWNRLALGVDHINYDARIEYVGTSDSGDQYKITVFKPYPETEQIRESIPVIYEQVVNYEGRDLKVFEIDGVAFILKKLPPPIVSGESR